MPEALTADEMRELSRLFSSLIASIHKLPPKETLLLLGVDERLRGDMLSRDDLEELRRISRDGKRS